MNLEDQLTILKASYDHVISHEMDRVELLFRPPLFNTGSIGINHEEKKEINEKLLTAVTTFAELQKQKIIEFTQKREVSHPHGIEGRAIVNSGNSMRAAFGELVPYSLGEFLSLIFDLKDVELKDDQKNIVGRVADFAQQYAGEDKGDIIFATSKTVRECVGPKKGKIINATLDVVDRYIDSKYFGHFMETLREVVKTQAGYISTDRFAAKHLTDATENFLRDDVYQIISDNEENPQVIGSITTIIRKTTGKRPLNKALKVLKNISEEKLQGLYLDLQNVERMNLERYGQAQINIYANNLLDEIGK
jgi:hypothetical protein